MAVFLGLIHVSAETISIENVVLKPGETGNVVICLNNDNTELVSFQMDLYLPYGYTLNKADCSLSSRFDSSYELTIGKQSDGAYRLTSTSFSLIPITSNE